MAVERGNGETHPSERVLSKKLMLRLLYGSLGYRILIVILDSAYVDRKTTAAQEYIIWQGLKSRDWVSSDDSLGNVQGARLNTQFHQSTS